MTVYWLTLAGLCYALVLTRLLDPRLDQRAIGRWPSATSSRILLGSAALLLILVAGLRWGVGTDFWQYVRNYHTYKISFFDHLLTYDEPGIRALAWAVFLVKDDPAVFIFAASAITIALMLRTITRYSTDIAMSYLLFVVVGSWHGSFNGVRQILACAIIVSGHRYVVNRKFLPYLAVVILASAFHVSAAFMLALYFVPLNQLRRRTILLLALGALMALYASDAVLDMLTVLKGDEGLIDYITRPIHPARIAVAVAPMAFYWTRGVQTEIDGEWFYRNLAIIHAVVMVAASWSAYLGRFGIFTTAFMPLVLPRLIDLEDRRITFIIRTGVVLLYVAFWYVEISGSPDLVDFHWVRAVED